MEKLPKLIKKYFDMQIEDCYFSGSSMHGTVVSHDAYTGLQRSDTDIVLLLDPNWVDRFGAADLMAMVEHECKRVIVPFLHDTFFDECNIKKQRFCFNISRELEMGSFFPNRLDIDLVLAKRRDAGGIWILEMEKQQWIRNDPKAHSRAWSQKVACYPALGVLVQKLKIWSKNHAALRNGEDPLKGVHIQAVLLKWEPPQIASHQVLDRADLASLLAEAFLFLAERLNDTVTLEGQDHPVSLYVQEDAQFRDILRKKLFQSAELSRGLPQLLRGASAESSVANLSRFYEAAFIVGEICNLKCERHDKPNILTEDALLLDFAMNTFLFVDENSTKSVQIFTKEALDTALLESSGRKFLKYRHSGDWSML